MARRSSPVRDVTGSDLPTSAAATSLLTSAAVTSLAATGLCRHWHGSCRLADDSFWAARTAHLRVSSPIWPSMTWQHRLMRGRQSCVLTLGFISSTRPTVSVEATGFHTQPGLRDYPTFDLTIINQRELKATVLISECDWSWSYDVIYFIDKNDG